jgi:DNA-binding CsgD family transcriptional regulator
VRTVDRHLGNIYPKIGARNKAEAVAFAVRHGLGPGVQDFPG